MTDRASEIQEMMLNRCTNNKDPNASMDVNIIMQQLIPDIWSKLCREATENLIQRAVNVWKNCEGTGDILKATYGQVAEQHTPLQRYCNFIFLKSRDIINNHADMQQNGIFV